MPSHRRFATAGLASVIAMIALGTSSAHAKTCWPYGTITATAGIALKNTTAKKFSRINWRVKVRAVATAGTAYADWGLAVNRRYHCEKKLGTWRCNAEATPCRP